jgi:probable phosphoglycerate mutase
MKIVFVRHGHPNYQSGHITELGHLHAAAVAKVLAAHGIEKIYSSPLLRAVETAQYTADALGLPVEIEDCFAEIGWGSVDGEPILEKGHPWNIADRHAEQGRSLTDPDWALKAPWSRNKVTARVEQTVAGFDAYMARHGYLREGESYRVTEVFSPQTVAVFGHGGATTAILAHLMNMPFPQACRLFDMDFTNITVAKFNSQPGLLCTPRFDVIGNAEHIRGITAPKGFMK